MFLRFWHFKLSQENINSWNGLLCNHLLCHFNKPNDYGILHGGPYFHSHTSNCKVQIIPLLLDIAWISAYMFFLYTKINIQFECILILIIIHHQHTFVSCKDHSTKHKHCSNSVATYVVTTLFVMCLLGSCLNGLHKFTNWQSDEDSLIMSTYWTSVNKIQQHSSMD